MRYRQIQPGRFLCRPNRFIAHVQLGNVTVICHVKNTGRCAELLVPGATVWLHKAGHPGRKTDFDLIAVQRGGRLINIDASAPNHVVREWLPASGLFGPDAVILPEPVVGHSRFDFLVQDGPRQAFIEVKGVTLEENGIAKFPDAPTERGLRHVETLCRWAETDAAYLIFLIQMEGVDCFMPNKVMQPAFHQAVLQAQSAGVHLLAFDCLVAPNSIVLHRPVPLCFS